MLALLFCIIHYGLAVLASFPAEALLHRVRWVEWWGVLGWYCAALWAGQSGGQPAAACACGERTTRSREGQLLLLSTSLLLLLATVIISNSLCISLIVISWCTCLTRSDNWLAGGPLLKPSHVLASWFCFRFEPGRPDFTLARPAPALIV